MKKNILAKSERPKKIAASHRIPASRSVSSSILIPDPIIHPHSPPLSNSQSPPSPRSSPSPPPSPTIPRVSSDQTKGTPVLTSPSLRDHIKRVSSWDSIVGSSSYPPHTNSNNNVHIRLSQSQSSLSLSTPASIAGNTSPQSRLRLTHSHSSIVLTPALNPRSSSQQNRAHLTRNGSTYGTLIAPTLVTLPPTPTLADIFKLPCYLKRFSALVNAEWLVEVPVIVVFATNANFAAKLAEMDLDICFPEYEGIITVYTELYNTEREKRSSSIDDKTDKPRNYILYLSNNLLDKITQIEGRAAVKIKQLALS